MREPPAGRRPTPREILEVFRRERDPEATNAIESVNALSVTDRIEFLQFQLVTLSSDLARLIKAFNDMNEAVQTIKAAIGYVTRDEDATPGGPK